MKVLRFNDLDEIHKNSKKELNSKKVFKTIEKINKKLNFNKSLITFSEEYSPTYAILKYFFKDFKNLKLLEIGFSVPYFLEFLKSKNFIVKGIDINPFMENEEYLKLSIENLTKFFLNENKSTYNIITSRITLSKLYNENFEIKNGKFAYQNSNKILKNISYLLKNKGILILQEDRGSIFTEKNFLDNNFKCIIKPYPIILYDKNKKYNGWNVISAYIYEKIK